ncbi:aldehyde ferredoxin oxidoreductase family protein [Chloroflexota bacterium]
MLGGFTGKILFVDLTEGSIKEESPPESLYRDFIGGIGLGVRILYEYIKPGADPLGPGNMLGFVTGPLTATPTPGSGRLMVVTKSPLTGGWADSNTGGSLGPELKAAGYDAVFFSGIAPKPVYLLLSDGKAELKDASHLWGKDTNETDNILQQEWGEPKLKVSCIGMGGESCCLIAGIVNEKGRIAGRSGVGAVMGSKRLKAVAIRGKEKVAVADTEKLRTLRNQLNKDFKEGRFQQSLAKVGTGGGLSHLVTIGDSPVKNWNLYGLEVLPSCENLNGANMDKYKLEGYGCHACPVRCGAIIRVEEGPFTTSAEVHRPEYESLAALGSLCMNDNVEAVIRANELCNLYGLDTIAVGTAIAFAMECYGRGLISKQDTDGMELTWGDGEVIVALVKKMAHREGFGAVLADGVEKAAERIGKGSEEYAIHVHGQALPLHDPRGHPGQGTIYMADANPCRHMDSHGIVPLEHGRSASSAPALQVPELEVYGDYTIKGPMYAIGAEFNQLFSSCGLCALLMIGTTTPLAELVSAVTGWDFSLEEGLKAARRILTLRQAFNAREGLSPAEFKLPKRFLKAAAIGPAAGAEIDFDSLRSGYFTAMDWDLKSGKPYRQALRELGLDELTGDLWQ